MVVINPADTAAVQHGAAPRHHNLLVWSYAPEHAWGNRPPGKGYEYLTKVYVPEPITLTKIWWAVGIAASAEAAGVYLGVRNSSGTLLGQTADQAAAVTTTGVKSAALTAESGQTLALAGGPDEFIYMTFLFATQGVTPAQFRRTQDWAPMTNAGLVAADKFVGGWAGTGALTVLPASVDVTALNAEPAFWLAGS